MTSLLSRLYGKLVIVRAPVPATMNKAGANYKSEVAHLSYSPRRAFEEWIGICERVCACGGDALFELEDDDLPFLGAGNLHVDGDGAIRPAGSSEILGDASAVLTGRVFTANGPWVAVEDGQMRAIMPSMLAHRRGELTYHRRLLERIADEAGNDLTVHENPHRWEGMADVAAVGNHVVLTFAVPGHYDQDTDRKTARSSRAGCASAADFAGIEKSARVFAELRYPHFHGDTVHFVARPTEGPPVLVHYPGGLWGDGAERIAAALGPARIVEVDRDDAVTHYAANSRQIGSGVLVTDRVSHRFRSAIENLGLAVHPIQLSELFGKAGGGPACATLQLPVDLSVPERSPLRYSQLTAQVAKRRAMLPDKLTVAPEFFAGKRRG